ncbi:MAG: hypothetical protein K9N07_01250 [Candidatus Cloacimonetes bacterium]|nr:hypothetical protein [Candidatus Cloacimonadota bacterium]
MSRNRKLKAAIAGVIQYIQQEDAEKQQEKPNKWVLSGRKNTMLNNVMIQMREFKR